MNKLRLTLKWRLTLLTIFLITLSGIALTIAINIDVRKSIPITPEAIMGEHGEIRIKLDLEEVLPKQEIGENLEKNGDEVTTISQGEFEIVMKAAISNIYTTSIITLLIVLCFGGVCAYFVVQRALMPVKKLNENIKSINENNLLSTLEVEGPHDEIKELTISYNQMLAKLSNAFTSQKRFNASVAHELKTPLTVIKTNIDVLNEQTDKSEADYQETMAIISESVIKLNHMIEMMMDLVKQENAPLDDEIDLELLIGDVVEDLEVVAKEKGITLEVNNLQELPTFMGNEILMYRAFYNIVENGIKYNVAKGKVTILARGEKDQILIKIEDTGKGIKEEEIPHIFEPFYRVDKMNIESSKGLGLGLSLVQSTIAIHGGKVEVTSKIHEGTCFSISLPI